VKYSFFWDVIATLLRVGYRRFGIKIGSIFKFKEIGQIGFAEKSAINYQSTLRNVQEERSCRVNVRNDAHIYNYTSALSYVTL
jgi:hypothetical protein